MPQMAGVDTFAPPDASNSQMALQPHIYRDLGYDAFEDFVPISRTARSEVAFAVSDQSPVHSIKEPITWLKVNPSQALCGSPGIGTGPYFAGFLFARLSGLDLRHALYKGTPAALPNVLATRVPVYSRSPPNSSNSIRAAPSGSSRQRMRPARRCCPRSRP
jgi:tripartite-type tricarboxylate transporter receptor subunit TctC